MRNFKIATALMLLCVCSSVFAQETKTDRAVRAVKELCLTGKQFDLKADAKGNLTLRKLLPGGEGAVSVNVRESSGAAAIFDEKIRQIADEDIRRCIQPHIKPIIDAILAENPKPNPQVIQYVGRVTDRNTNQPIRRARISLDMEGVPSTIYTDSGGIYRFKLRGYGGDARVRVEAQGYEVYEQFITISPDNQKIEDILLVPLVPADRARPGALIPPPPSPDLGKCDQNTDYNRDYNHGVKNMQASKYDLAINDFSKVIICKPDHDRAYYNRGVCYQAKGKNDKAINDFKKVLELSNNPELIRKAKHNLDLMSADPTDKASTGFALSISVPSTTNAGVELPVPYPGDCTVQYVKGGYKLNAQDFNRWSTALIIFKNLKDPEEKWIGNSPNTNSEHKVAIIGGKITRSQEEAEKAARGIKTGVGRLKATDTLTFMAMDGKTSYGDNEGEVELELSCVPR